MKKLTAILLAFLLGLSMFSCNSADDETPSSETESETPSDESEPAESESESESETETIPSESEKPSYIDPSGLPNKSIPYGNDWEQKDNNGLAAGVHYYESLYGKYNPYYYVKTDEKKLYLTFDEGYEAGYTPKILDTLKEKNVKAVFFLTKQFVDSDPALVQRMIDEGHIIGNHTCLHPEGGFPRYVDSHGLASFTDDVNKLHNIVKERFGYDMFLFRFPEGEASELLMATLNNMGYQSVFWSYAHYDYNRSAQPEVSVTLNRLLGHMGKGCIYLLHAVSSSNTEALGDFIDGARAEGYDFYLLTKN